MAKEKIHTQKKNRKNALRVRSVEKLGEQETSLAIKESEDIKKARLARRAVGKMIRQARHVAIQAAKVRKVVGNKMRPYWYRPGMVALHEI